VTVKLWQDYRAHGCLVAASLRAPRGLATSSLQPGSYLLPTLVCALGQRAAWLLTFCQRATSRCDVISWCGVTVSESENPKCLFVLPTIDAYSEMGIVDRLGDALDCLQDQATLLFLTQVQCGDG
jgi:hypothetical protein